MDVEKTASDQKTGPDHFLEIWRFIVKSKGQYFDVLFDELEKRDRRINKYREPIITISNVLLHEIFPGIKTKLPEESQLENAFGQSGAIQLVNLWHFSAMVLLKDLDKIDSFNETDPICKRFDIFYPNAMELKIFALFQGFLIRRPEDKRDPMYEAAGEFLNLLNNKAELSNTEEELRRSKDTNLKFKQMNITYTEIFSEIVEKRRNSSKNPTKTLGDIAKGHGLRDHTAILKTFQDKLPLMKEVGSLILRFKSKYPNSTTIKPLKLLFELATDQELFSIGSQLDNNYNKEIP